jgi:hypothetical protein
VKERPKEVICGLLTAFIHRSFMVLIDCALLGLLGLFDGIVIGALIGWVPLKDLMLILLVITGVWRAVTRRRSTMSHKRLA